MGWKHRVGVPGGLMMGGCVASLDLLDEHQGALRTSHRPHHRPHSARGPSPWPSPPSRPWRVPGSLPVPGLCSPVASSTHAAGPLPISESVLLLATNPGDHTPSLKEC